MISKPAKVLDYKTYNSIPHLSKSRLGPSDSTIDMKSELKMTTSFPKGCKLILQEKMDGTNVSVVRFNGELRTLSRSGYDCATSDQEQHRMFNRYVMKYKEVFNELLPNEHDRLVGEWCALAHGTIYEGIIIPFYALDLYRNKVQQSHANLIGDVFHAVNKTGQMVIVPAPYDDMDMPVPIEDALIWVNNRNPNAEGIVYRLEKFGSPYLIAKVVKMDKVDGKYLMVDNELERIWNWKDSHETI